MLLSLSAMTFAAPSTDPAAITAAALDWWALAGVDLAVQDNPRGWLDRQRAVASPASAAAPVVSIPVPPPVAATVVPVAQQPAAAPMPADLDGFLEWLKTDPGQPEAAFSRMRVLPGAFIQPEVALVTDMPSREDMDAGQLFSGEDAALLSSMLRAIGISMAGAATVSLLLARPAGGVIDDALAERVMPRTLHLLRLLAPKAVILLGDQTNRAFSAVNGRDTALPTRMINLDNGTVSALSLPASFVLAKHPERKAAAWAQLRHMAK